MPTLTIQLPGLPPVSHVLKDETITIGRMKGNTIVIDDSSISLMHAKITRKDADFYLKDLNSTNGTLVNGQPIGEVRLRDHDRIRFAEITTQFQSDSSAISASLAPVSIPAQPAPAPAARSAPAAAPLRNRAAPTLETNPGTRLRAVAVTASIAIIVLAGLGIVGWKYFNSSRQSAENAAAPTPPKTKRLAAAEPATQVSPSRPAIQAKPVPETTETAAIPSLNIPELVSALKSKEVAERRQAAAALHGAGAEAKDAIPALRESLKDSDQEVQMWAALALVNTQTYEKAVIPILIRALKNENIVLRQVACLSLGLIPYEAGDKETVIPALTETATRDNDEAVRQAAKSALNIVGSDTPESAAVK